MIYAILKHGHLAFISVAVVMLLLRFYWLKTGNANAHKPVYQKLHQHSNYTVLLLGVILAFYVGYNPFNESGYWLLEKLLAFIAYLLMVSNALNMKKRPHIQWLTFLGAFGWLIYIAKLGITKQAIILVG